MQNRFEISTYRVFSGLLLSQVMLTICVQFPLKRRLHKASVANLPLSLPGKLSRYSYALRAGPSGDRIPVIAEFSAPVQTDPRPTLPPVQWVPPLFPGEGGGQSGWDVALTTQQI